MTPHLRSLAKTLVDLEQYSDLSVVADLLSAFHSGNWPKLGTEDQEFYLEKMEGTFHVRGMGDTPAGGTPEYGFIVERVAQELRALRRKK